MSRALLGLVVVLGVLMLVRRPAATRPAVVSVRPPSDARPHPRQTSQAGGPPPPLPAPLTAPSSSATPTIDLLARLESRRRLIRAGASTYLDSLLAISDSTIRRWPDQGAPLRVALLGSDSGVKVPRESEQLLRTALQRWENAGAGLNLTITNDSATADIRVRWIDRFDLDRAGQTDVQSTSDGVIHSALVSVATHLKTGQALDEAALDAVMTHEIGHALGLPHSDRPSDVMFPTAHGVQPSVRDRATLQLLYLLPPGSVRE